MTGSRTYSVAIVRELDLDALAVLSDEEADAGEDDGLQGNQQYRDMRRATWDQVADALAQEAALFQRFAASADLDEEAELYEQEREDAFLPEEDLWGLDIGVIGATLALSALGATCVFHAIVGTDSTGWWARIPREGGHGFHAIVGASQLRG